MGPTSFCHFSQRLQRPEFVRLTKHAYRATEDISYSYVIVRRGPRPVVEESYVQNGGPERMRSGAVAREEEESQTRRENMQEGGHGVVQEDETGTLHFKGNPSVERIVSRSEAETAADMASLRLESYGWPRVIYPPIKRSGHVILDSCTIDGECRLQPCTH